MAEYGHIGRMISNLPISGLLIYDDFTLNYRAVKFLYTDVL